MIRIESVEDMERKGANEAQRSRGRVPKDAMEAHEAALIEAATRLFLEHGYRGTSIEMLSRGASASPKTIYGRYGGKAGLFREVMQRHAARTLAPFRDLTESPDAPEAVLREFGRRLLTLVLSPNAMAATRIVTAEATRFPELAAIYYEHGPQHLIRMLAGYFEACAERGSLAIPNPEVAAEVFVALTEGELVRRALLAIPPHPSEEEVENQAQEAVRLFLAACANRPKGLRPRRARK